MYNKHVFQVTTAVSSQLEKIWHLVSCIVLKASGMMMMQFITEPRTFIWWSKLPSTRPPLASVVETMW